jgi:hypothetical protein
MATTPRLELDWISIDCPYCGERYETPADPSAGSTSYVEDCAVCCRPIVIELRVDPDGTLIGCSTRREAD